MREDQEERKKWLQNQNINENSLYHSVVTEFLIIFYTSTLNFKHERIATMRQEKKQRKRKNEREREVREGEDR